MRSWNTEKSVIFPLIRVPTKCKFFIFLCLNLPWPIDFLYSELTKSKFLSKKVPQLDRCTLRLSTKTMVFEATFTRFLKRKLDFETFSLRLQKVHACQYARFAQKRKADHRKNIFVNEILSPVAKKSDQVQDTYRGLHFWTLLEICVLQET